MWTPMRDLPSLHNMSSGTALGGCPRISEGANLTSQIQGESWGGVNAANLAAQMQMDYLLGTTDARYAEIVRGRYRYLIPEDRHAIEADMALPSLADRFLSQLHLPGQSIITCDSQALAAHLAVQSPGLQASLRAYARVLHAAGKLTAMHWALIQNFLIKPAAQLSQAERASLPVSPEGGTGGKSHAETMGIRDMRREHPVLKKLFDGINRPLGVVA